jgi:cytochrome oxidase assembly protein ShyY1
MEQDAKQRVVGTAVGITVGMVALVVFLTLGIWFYKRRNNRQTAQEVKEAKEAKEAKGVQTNQNPTATAKSEASPYSPRIVQNALGLSQ